MELELNDGATFERLLGGTVSLGTEDRDDGLAIFDESMRAVVTVVHDELGDAEARSLRVGWITGVLDGETSSPPSISTPTSRRRTRAAIGSPPRPSTRSTG